MSQTAAGQITQRVNYANSVDGKLSLGPICREYQTLTAQVTADAQEVAEQQSDVYYARTNALPYADELDRQLQEQRFTANQRLGLLATKGRLFERFEPRGRRAALAMGGFFLDEAENVHTLILRHEGIAFRPWVGYWTFSSGYPVEISGAAFAQTEIPGPKPGWVIVDLSYKTGLGTSLAIDPRVEPELSGWVPVNQLCNGESLRRLSWTVRVNFLGSEISDLKFVVDPEKIVDVPDWWQIIVTGGWVQERETNPQIYAETWSAVRRLLVEMLSEAPDYAAQKSFTRTLLNTDDATLKQQVSRVRQRLGALGFQLRHDRVRRISSARALVEIGTWMASSGLCNGSAPAISCERAQSAPKNVQGRLPTFLQLRRSLGAADRRLAETNPPFAIPYPACDFSVGVYAVVDLPQGPRLQLHLSRDGSGPYRICALRLNDEQLWG